MDILESTGFLSNYWWAVIASDYSVSIFFPETSPIQSSHSSKAGLAEYPESRETKRATLSKGVGRPTSRNRRRSEQEFPG